MADTTGNHVYTRKLINVEFVCLMSIFSVFTLSTGRFEVISNRFVYDYVVFY